MTVVSAFVGSFPLARGAPQIQTTFTTIQRIIPACAGSTLLAQILVNDLGDHPRLRGEHALLRPVVAVGSGSSPLARGAQSDS